MAAVFKQDLVIPQGGTYIHKITYPEDISSREFRMQFRASSNDTSILYSATSTGGQFAANWNSGNGVTDITLTISAVDTADFDFAAAKYDIEGLGATEADVLKIMKGSVQIEKEITK